ncbi:hypothetical protein AVEN_212105-1 [Araneus ventricosus]|uniref:Alpha-D-phosphohexomutase alpha/beta/alpha domain-containing protein n=1 Tax=Araneus ventricosus TaxID=182803 RepID=A0A4Y2RDZ5_ARAVE|nr:hypothetical protein AVEN_212105-1 [Araneus ventricosus]
MYYGVLKMHCRIDRISSSEFSLLKITFTAINGASRSYMKRASPKLKFMNVVPVKEQMYPGPDFPAIEFPNPEGNSLDLSIATADAAESRLILDNDPDAERLAVSEKLENDSS